MSSQRRSVLGTFERVYQVVRLIPRGQDATYGQIASIVSHMRGARTVGWALGALREGSHVPWQRVINARGEISTGHRTDAAATQRVLLEGEGVVFDQQGRVDLAKYQWPGLDWPQVEALHIAWNKEPPASR